MAGVIPLLNPQNLKQEQFTVSTQADLFLANDAFSLRDLFDELDGELISKEGENKGLGILRFDIGVSDPIWGYIGYTYREEISLRASQNTVELIYNATNDLDLENAKVYDLDLKINAFEVHGILFAKSLGLYKKNTLNFNIGVGIELLYGKKMQDGYIKGSAQAVSKKDYNFNATSDYRYTHNYLYDLDVDNSKAYGYTTHISASLEYETVSLLVVVNDLFGKLHWKNLPSSTINLSSNNKSYDSNGYVNYRPLISGRELTSNYVQTIMRKYSLEGTYNFKDSLVSIGLEHIYGLDIPYITYKKMLTNHLNLNLNYETRFGSFATKINYKNYTFGIRSDDLIKPSTFSLTLGASF